MSDSRTKDQNCWCEANTVEEHCPVHGSNQSEVRPSKDVASKDIGAQRYVLRVGHSDDAGLGAEGWVVRMSDHFPSCDTAQKWVKSEDYEALRQRFEKACQRVTELESSAHETSEQRSASWLIEIHGERAQWLERIGTSTWGAYDAGKAIRFSRKEDAEALIPVVKMLGPTHWRLTSTEHMWIEMRPEEPACRHDWQVISAAEQIYVCRLCARQMPQSKAPARPLVDTDADGNPIRASGIYGGDK